MKKKLMVAAGLGLVQLAWFSTPSHAQDTSKVLKDVIVTATRSPKKTSEIGRVVEVITNAEISRWQGKTLPELLNTVPGITFSGANNAPGISSSIYLRGASTGNTLILIDGFPVNNAAAVDGSYDLNAFPLDQIERIEILKGTGSTLYGSDAVAGVINIITKHAEKNGILSSVQLSGGTYNTYKESLSLIGKVNNTDLAFNFSNTDSKGFPAATDTTGNGGFKDDGFHQKSIILNISQHLSSNIILNGNFQTTINNGDLPEYAYFENNGYTYKNTFLNAGIGAKLLLTKGALIFNLNQNNIWNNYFDVGSTTKNRGEITNLEGILNLKFDDHFDVTSGVDYKKSGTNQFYSYAPNPGLDNNYQSPITLDATNSINSIYTSLFYKANIFHMELGGRFNHHNKYGDNLTYTINPSLYLFKQFKLFTTLASAFKSPSLYQLYSNYGNTNLKPETTTSYEAGFDWEIINSTLNFSTVFYKNNTSDVIYFYTNPNTYASIYKNGQQQNDKGFESDLKFKFKKLTASAYMAYVTGTLTDENGIKTNNLYRRPSHTFGVNFNYQVLKPLSVGVNFKYTGDRTDLQFNQDYSTSIITLKPYSLVDVQTQYNATKHISIFADFKNIFNEKYTDWLGYNTRGFNFMAGIKYAIN